MLTFYGVEHCIVAIKQKIYLQFQVVLSYNVDADYKLCFCLMRSFFTAISSPISVTSQSFSISREKDPKLNIGNWKKKLIPNYTDDEFFRVLIYGFLKFDQSKFWNIKRSKFRRILTIYQTTSVSTAPDPNLKTNAFSSLWNLYIYSLYGKS